MTHRGGLIVSILIVLLFCSADIALAKKKKVEAEAVKPLPPPSLTDSSIEELETASAACQEKNKPIFTYSVTPLAGELWPTQYVQIRWFITTQKDEKWHHKVYLRQDDRKPEYVTPIWMRSIKATELKEGLHTFHLVTYCGVQKVEYGLVPKPQIITSPYFIIRGEAVEIIGKDFGTSETRAFREVRIKEPGGTTALEIIEWSDTNIKARITEEVILGVRSIYVVSGTSSYRTRKSVEHPLLVLKQKRIPILSLTAELEDIFSEMEIRLNNLSSKRSGSRLKKEDAFIELGANLGSARSYLKLPEYNFIPEDDNETPASYYINDINMDNVSVLREGADFNLTFYFESLHDEFVGINPDNLDIRAFVPLDKRPPIMQIENLQMHIPFNLTVDKGAVVFSQGEISTNGYLSSTASECQFGSFDICAELESAFKSDILAQLSAKMTEVLNDEANRAMFHEAMGPWFKLHGVGEIVHIRLEDDDLVVDYYPK